MTGRRLLAAVAVAAGISGAMAGIWIAFPVPDNVPRPPEGPGFTITDRHGLPLRSTRAAGGARRNWVPLAAIDPDLVAAVIAIEDHRFYRHWGIDLRAVFRASRDNLRAGSIRSGASTITMQLARLAASLPRTWPGKVRQALWAVRLEAHLDKQTILEAYLNRVPLGQGTMGVAAAASLYFDASPGELSLGQAALLAGIARSPSSNNPLVSPGRAAQRRFAVLTRLAASGYASTEDVARAHDEPVLRRAAATFAAPHFTTHILQRMDRGETAPGPEWQSTLDLPLQNALEAEVRHTVQVLRVREVREAAVVVLENASGDVLAWVGSPDFWADTSGQVDMVVSARQPGSALKPFLYGLAFDRGFTPASVLPDVERPFTTPQGVYRPRNYDRRFRGPVSLREALGSSYNVPAVDLASRIGVASLHGTLERAGFTTLDRSAEHYGLGLALGNGDVTLLELANAYRAIANLGVWRPYRWDAESHHDAVPGRRIMSERSAALVLDVLGDPGARVPAFGVETPFDFPFPVAVKTGTSRHFTDNWAVAVTERFTVAVWVGNFSGKPMEGVSGVSGAGPLLRRALFLTASRYEPGVLPGPEVTGAHLREVCRISGKRPGAFCPVAHDWFAPGTEPDGTCDWHVDGRLVLPPAYASWMQEPETAPMREALGMALAIPSRQDSVAGNQAAIAIISPRNGDRYSRPPGVEWRYASIPLRARSDGPVRWLVDGRPTPGARWRLEPGAHTIRVVGPRGAWDEVRITVQDRP